jgi:hypothetical protein
VTPLSFSEARALVIDKVESARRVPDIELVDLVEAGGRASVSVLDSVSREALAGMSC